MIIVLFGQPTSGKSTLANKLLENKYSLVNIDGDKIRKIFKNDNYTREGRIQNLNRASDIAIYLNKSLGHDVVLSLVYPYQEARDYLNSLCNDVKWVYLTYDGKRDRDSFHVADFDAPQEGTLILNTSKLSIEECIEQILYV